MEEERLRALLVFCWQYGLCGTGKSFRIAERGRTAEAGEGCDFVRAVVETGGGPVTGALSVLVRTSDYRKKDVRAEKADMLAVLADDAVVIRDEDQRRLPVFVVHIPEGVLRLYERLLEEENGICPAFIASLPAVQRRNLLERLFFERLELKCGGIERRWNELGCWNDVFFALLFDTVDIGNATNRALLRELAGIVRYGSVTNGLSGAEETEALLLGVSGLLDKLPEPDDYILRLRRLFLPLRKQFGLRVMDPDRWSFAGRNPRQTPYIVLARLATLLYTHKNLGYRILDCRTAAEVKELFDVGVSPYWQCRCRPGEEPRSPSPKRFTDARKEVLVINLAVPFLFAYRRHNKKEDPDDIITGMAEALRAEDNRYVRFWNAACGGGIDNALLSQAVIQQARCYCEPRRCTRCLFGRLLLSRGTN